MVEPIKGDLELHRADCADGAEVRKRRKGKHGMAGLVGGRNRGVLFGFTNHMQGEGVIGNGLAVLMEVGLNLK